MKAELARFGYTEREAAFLSLVALLSGYFLRKQFNVFIGKECGAIAQRFLERGLGLGHFEPLSALGGRVVYHVGARALYAALGDPDSRNRREHQHETVRRRLMCIDFVLAHPGARWLLTEGGKVEHFVGWGVCAGDLPRETFLGGTTSYFVDKQPIELLASGAPRFAFVDEALGTFSKWEVFLRAHRALLQRLPSAEVVFASCDSDRFRHAEDLFRRTIVGETSMGIVDSERLVRFFSARRSFEQKRFESFDQARLDELRETRRVFAGPEFEQLYTRWLEHGDAALQIVCQSRARFSTQLLPSFYEWLSPIRIHERRA